MYRTVQDLLIDIFKTFCSLDLYQHFSYYGLKIPYKHGNGKRPYEAAYIMLVMPTLILFGYTNLY